MSALIGKRLNIKTVTIILPHDERREIDKSKESSRAPELAWYPWGAVESLNEQLMDGRIQELRLGYCATYLKSHCTEEEAEGVEDLDAIPILRKWKKGPPQLDFNATLKDNLVSDIGTVLVLTHPSRG